MRFSGDLALRTHMRMHGSWHIYRPGERWQRPPREMRVLVGTADFVAVGFNVPDAEFEAARDVGARDAIARLGPDLLAPDFDAAEAVRRLQARGDMTIADALLDQRALAGIGNVFKSEVLFEGGVEPFATVATIAGDRLAALVDIARRQLAANVGGAASRPWAPHHRPARAGRRPVGLRARRPAVPAVRHADFVREAGRRSAPYLLVPDLPDGLNDSGVQDDSGVVGRRAVRETRRRIAYATSTPRPTSVRGPRLSPAID